MKKFCPYCREKKKLVRGKTESMPKADRIFHTMMIIMTAGMWSIVPVVDYMMNYTLECSGCGKRI